MFYSIAFNIVGISIMIALVILGVKMFSLASYIRKTHATRLQGVWNSWQYNRRLKEIREETKDQSSREAIDKMLKYRRWMLAIMVGGFLVLFLIGATNATFRGNG